MGVVYTCGQIVKLLETKITLVEANEGIAAIPSFGRNACRNRKVTKIRASESYCCKGGTPATCHRITEKNGN